MEYVCQSLFFCRQHLSAWTSTFLATGQARELRGKYFDVNYVLDDILHQVDIVNKNKLYQLKTQRRRFSSLSGYMRQLVICKFTTTQMSCVLLYTLVS